MHASSTPTVKHTRLNSQLFVVHNVRGWFLKSLCQWAHPGQQSVHANQASIYSFASDRGYLSSSAFPLLVQHSLFKSCRRLSPLNPPGSWQGSAALLCIDYLVSHVLLHLPPTDPRWDFTVFWAEWKISWSLNCQICLCLFSLGTLICILSWKISPSKVYMKHKATEIE